MTEVEEITILNPRLMIVGKDGLYYYIPFSKEQAIRQIEKALLKRSIIAEDIQWPDANAVEEF